MSALDTRALRISLLYAACAALWILLSDRLAALAGVDSRAVTELQTYKGWFFVLVTSGLLYFVLRRSLAGLSASGPASAGDVVEQPPPFWGLLRWRLVALVGLGLLPMLGLVGILGLEWRREQRQQARDDALRTLAAANARLELLAEGTRQLLQALALSPRLRDGQWTGLSADLAELQRSAPRGTQLRVVDPAGRVVARTGPQDEPGQRGDQPWIQTALRARTFVLGPMMIDPDSNTAVWAVAQPVWDTQGTVRAVLLAAIDLEWLNQIDEDMALPAASVVTLVDRQGTVLAHSLDIARWRGQQPAALREIGHRTGDAGGFAERVGLDGVKRVYLSAPAFGAKGEAVLDLGIPRAAIYGAVDRAMTQSLVIVLLVTFLALAAAGAFAHLFVLDPARALTRAARRMAGGDLAARSGVAYRPDEIGMVARTFDEMATALEARTTELRRLNLALEARVRERTAELESANNELESFSYSVSHDLRAPLRSIDGFSQALWEECGAKLDEGGREHLQRVRAASQRMSQLIDDLLALARVTRAELNVTEVDLSGLVRRIQAELARSEPERSVTFAIAAGLRGRGDERLLQVALENLLGNAWKFTRRTAVARIEFGSRETDGERVFFVRDNGAGFDMQYAGKLFGAFQRLHAASDFPGTGVGLATVQRIVRRHGGRLWGEAKVDAGATFYFTLGEPPVAPAATAGTEIRESA